MNEEIVLVIRTCAMLTSAVVIGLCARLFIYYLGSPRTTLFRTRALLICGGISIYAFVGVWAILDKVLNREPWEFHTSPGVFLGSILIAVGLFRFVERRRYKNVIV